jgi:hypothetical protein
MKTSTVIAVVAGFTSFLAPFFFPWKFTVGVSILASLFFPPAGLLSGLLLDILYSSAKGWPYFTLLGLLISVISYFVQQFVKTRIMS